jgi:hypothetical protein
MCTPYAVSLIDKICQKFTVCKILSVGSSSFSFKKFILFPGIRNYIFVTLAAEKGRGTIDRLHYNPGYATVRGNMNVANASEITLPPDCY